MFLSSTFQDMEAERTQIVQRLFPTLQRRFDGRAVTVVPIDLRWGLTKEDSRKERTLSLCMSAVDDCRPYFVGLVGDRYGWMPTPSEAFLSVYPHLASYVGRSATELEMRHALDATQPTTRSLFYVRQQPGPQTRPPEVERLLAWLAEAGHPPSPYADPADLCAQLGRDLGALIESRHPSDRPPTRHEQVREAHRARWRRLESLGIVDGALLAAFERARARSRAPLCVTSDVGGGKSSLIAAWLMRTTERASPVVRVSIGASPEHGTWRDVVRYVGQEIDGRAGTDRTTLRALSRRAKDAWIVIDGLDHLDPSDGGWSLDWLPDAKAASARLVVSATHPDLLRALQTKGYETFRIPPLGRRARARALEVHLGRFGKRLDRHRARRIRRHRPCANARYLAVVADELRVSAVHADLDAWIGRLLNAPDSRALFGALLRRWTALDSGADAQMVAPTMAALATSRSGHTETELLEIVDASGHPASRVRWHEFRAIAGDRLLEHRGVVSLADRELQDAIRDRLLAKDSAAGGVESREVHETAAIVMGGAPPSRRLIELPWRLLGAGRRDELRAFLRDEDTIEGMWPERPYEWLRYWAEIDTPEAPVRPDEEFERLLGNPRGGSPRALEAVSSLLGQHGHREQSLRLVRAAASRAEGKERTRLAASAASMEADMLAADGDPARAYRRLAKAATSLPLGRTDAARFQLDLAAAGRACGKLGATREHLEEARRLAEGEHDDITLLHVFRAELELQEATNDAAAGAAWRRLLEEARVLGDSVVAFDATMALAASAHQARAWKEAKRLLREADALANEIGSRAVDARAHVAWARVLCADGDYDSAMQKIDAYEKACRETNNTVGVAVALLYRAQFAAEPDALNHPVIALEELREAEAFIHRHCVRDEAIRQRARELDEWIRDLIQRAP